MNEVHIAFTVNKTPYTLTVPASLSLLEILREKLFLMGTKEGCGHGDCGVCLVLMNGKAVNSCLVLAGDVHQAHITTVEGMAVDGQMHPLQAAFLKHGAVQCGYCTSGMILSAKALIDDNPSLDEAAVREGLGSVICRCGTYPRVINAVLDAASQSKE